MRAAWGGGSDSFVTPWTVAHQDPWSMGFSRQECWSGRGATKSVCHNYRARARELGSHGYPCLGRRGPWRCSHHSWPPGSQPGAQMTEPQGSAGVGDPPPSRVPAYDTGSLPQGRSQPTIPNTALLLSLGLFPLWPRSLGVGDTSHPHRIICPSKMVSDLRGGTWKH